MRRIVFDKSQINFGGKVEALAKEMGSKIMHPGRNKPASTVI